VVTAVADGRSAENLAVKSKGEVAALAETINNMTETLAPSPTGDQRGARVGVEGASEVRQRAGRAGTWKDLTGNVQSPGANLTPRCARSRGRYRGDQGDLTVHSGRGARRSPELKDNINTMIGNLRLTTDRNTEQDWLRPIWPSSQHAPGPARPGHGRPPLSPELSPLVNAQQA